MRLSTTLLALLPAVFAAPILEPKKGAQLIPGQFIFKLHDDSSDDLLTSTLSEVVGHLGVQPMHVYNFGGFKGFSIASIESLIQSLPSLAAIEGIEQDSVVRANELVTQTDAPYGLARISHREKGNKDYVYDSSAGEGTYAYIIDTGIYVQHNEFEGRAIFAANFAGDGMDTDGNGHGTHVAGTTGSRAYGVAKKTNLIAVKVLGADGSGSNSGVLAGIDFAAKDASSKGRIGKAVANLSLGGIFSLMTNRAVAAAVKEGLFMAVAAGNDGVDAFFSSPASERTACTIGATDVNDKRAYFSNTGSRVDVFAPGVDILSTWKDGPDDTNTISGTSMATPHITGLGAYLLALEGPRSAEDLCQRIIDLSSKDIITDPGLFSPNRLAYNGDGK